MEFFVGAILSGFGFSLLALSAVNQMVRRSDSWLTLAVLASICFAIMIGALAILISL